VESSHRSGFFETTMLLNSTPSTITLCPSTCTTIQADTSPQIEILIGCATEIQIPSCLSGNVLEWEDSCGIDPTEGEVCRSRAIYAAGELAALKRRAQSSLAY
jgi:hypothetical protein